MRKQIMIANWKMNKTREEALDFIYAVNEKVPSTDVCDTVVCAPAIVLRDLVKRQGEFLRIGAQNMHFAENGAYTGEISPIMLENTGVEYVILGHSERRQYFNETDETVNLKMHAAIKHNLKPILCIGETLEEREAGKVEEVLKTQLVADLANIDPLDMENVIIAYEPIWAIGTGKTATSEDANAACHFVREVVKEIFNASVSEQVRVLYGGSMKPSNVKELLAQSDIDGGLVGGASLIPDSFLELCEACK